jgi:hypothetical protein
MADFGVIAAVSETLQTVLTNALSTLAPQPDQAPVAELHDLQGTISTSPARLTIFLFEAVEDPSARNRPRVRGMAPPDLTLQKPPMALLLRYLLTPWGGNRVTEHQILGRAMQVLYDGAILSGPDLKGSLAGTDDALKVTLAPLSLEERTRVWHAVQKPYRLSVSYEVRVVNLDTEQQDLLTPVRRRSLDFAVPEAMS